ncbi:MAG: hypothetical protein H7Z40_18575 [Phycisphaerae bacterium]|nr:hypothetical protein [Gemmatimonadaceae bacterium]
MLTAQTRPVAPPSPSSRAARPAPASPPLALIHVSVVDVESGQVSLDNTIVLSGNHIAAVGPNVRVPSGARVINARGKVLIPGLWDMHSHSLDRWSGRLSSTSPMV